MIVFQITPCGNSFIPPIKIHIFLTACIHLGWRRLEAQLIVSNINPKIGAHGVLSLLNRELLCLIFKHRHICFIFTYRAFFDIQARNLLESI